MALKLQNLNTKQKEGGFSPQAPPSGYATVHNDYNFGHFI
jgi:hypothetical protein